MAAYPWQPYADRLWSVWYRVGGQQTSKRVLPYGHHLEKPERNGWRRVGGRLNYISCGELGCWGVNKQHNIFFRYGVSRRIPQGKLFFQPCFSLRSRLSESFLGDQFLPQIRGQILFSAVNCEKQAWRDSLNTNDACFAG